jgi:DNA-binding transcriptional LysR family regulator
MSIDFDLRQLEIFRKVVELRSFSKAAEEVFLTQASVSERIANLELAIGAKLLDRLGRQITPTRVGELLYKHALLLLDMKKSAKLEIEHFLGKKTGELKIGGSTIPGEYILPQVIAKFNEKYPLVSVTLDISDTSEIEHRVIEGKLELGIIGSKSAHPSLIHHELWQDELVVAVPVTHPWAEKKELALEELVQEPFITRETGSGTLRIIEIHLKEKYQEGLGILNIKSKFGSSTAVKEGIKSGLGVSILSSRAIKSDIAMGSIKALRIKDIPMSRSFYLVRDKRRIASPLCQAMLDFLQGEKEA